MIRREGAIRPSDERPARSPTTLARHHARAHGSDPRATATANRPLPRLRISGGDLMAARASARCHAAGEEGARWARTRGRRRNCWKARRALTSSISRTVAPASSCDRRLLFTDQNFLDRQDMALVTIPYARSSYIAIRTERKLLGRASSSVTVAVTGQTFEFVFRSVEKAQRIAQPVNFSICR